MRYGRRYSGNDPGALLLGMSMAGALASAAEEMATECHFRLLPVLTAHLLALARRMAGVLFAMMRDRTCYLQAAMPEPSTQVA